VLIMILKEGDHVTQFTAIGELCLHVLKPLSSDMSNYDQLHRQCRTLENLFDSKLTSYSQLIHILSRPGTDVEASGSAERWKDLEDELDDLSDKVWEYFTIRKDTTDCDYLNASYS